MVTNRDIADIQSATDDLMEALNEVTYRLEHFIRKSNKSTALDVRNALRQLDPTKKAFKDASIDYFKE